MSVGDEGEVDCPDGHEHPDWTTMDLVVNFTVEQIFDLLFTDTSFFRSFLDSQGTTGQWSYCQIFYWCSFHFHF